MSATPAPTGPPPPSRCWNCQEPLSAGSARCLFCGVVQQQAVIAPVAVAPTAVAAPAPTYAPAAPVRIQQPQPVRVSGAATLGANFSGTAAGTGARIVAFTLDVIVVVVVAVTVGLLTGHIIYAALAFVEVIVGLWVLEARTGLTIGNGLLRLRASREDAPFSPGIGRSFVRSLITGLGFLALGFGAWVVVASSGFDSSRRGRSWADKAARTVVVSVPRRERVLTAPAIAPASGPLPAGVVPVGAPAPAPAVVQAAPGVQIIPAQEAPIVLAAPQVISTAARPSVIDESSASSSNTGVNQFVASPVPVMAAPAAPMARGIAPSGAASAEGTLLLIFDTGQREQLAIPVAVNLGRNPVVTEPTDKLITVTDPESTVSKTHLRLEHSRGSTWVTDGGSTNGTDLLSDEGEVTRLTAGDRVLLDEGARVRVGNRAFTISILLGENS